MAPTLLASSRSSLLPDALTVARWLHEAFCRHSEAPALDWEDVPERSQAMLVAIAADVLARISAEIWRLPPRDQ